MSIPNITFAHFVTCLGIGIWIGVTLIFAAVTGDLSVSVGTMRNSVRITSTPLRIVFFILPVGFFALVYWMIGDLF